MSAFAISASMYPNTMEVSGISGVKAMKTRLKDSAAECLSTNTVLFILESPKNSLRTVMIILTLIYYEVMFRKQTQFHLYSNVLG